MIGVPGLPRRRRSRHVRAVVTGAGSGIGRAIALELVRRSGRVVCADIDVERAGQTADEITRQVGGSAVAVACDVSELDQVEALADTAARWLGEPVDFVVNNAGVGAGGRPVGEMSVADWRWIMGINLWGVVHGCHVFAPRLRAAGRGSIINVASAASFAAVPNMAAYNVTKAGVLALSETMAAELGGSGVHLSVLCPTFVKTNIARDGRIPASSSQLAERLMSWSGMSADRVARSTLDAHDRGQLYVLPQIDARILWHTKRLAPTGYARSLALLNRITPSA